MCRCVVLSAALAVWTTALLGCSFVIDTTGLYGVEAGALDVPEAGPLDADSDLDAGTRRDADGSSRVDAAIPVLARDTFTRTVKNGFGMAEVGGAWTHHADASLFAVSSGVATTTVNAGAGAGAASELAALSLDDVDMQLVVSTDKLGSGTGLYLSFIGRQIMGARYTAALIIAASGKIDSEMRRKQGADETLLGREASVLTVVPGEAVRVRFQVMGATPTRLRMKVWKSAAAEPAAWIFDATDSNAVLQGKGSIGVDFYLSSSATNAPIEVSIDDLLVRPASLLP